MAATESRLQAIVQAFERDAAAVNRALSALEREAEKHRASIAKREAAEKAIADAKESRGALAEEQRALKEQFLEAISDDDADKQAEIRRRRSAITEELHRLTEAVARAEKTIADNPVKVRELAELWARGLREQKEGGFGSSAFETTKPEAAIKELTDEVRSIEAALDERVEALRGYEFSRYVDYEEYKSAEGRLRTGDPDYKHSSGPAPFRATGPVTSTNDVGEKLRRDPRHGRPGVVMPDFED